MKKIVRHIIILAAVAAVVYIGNFSNGYSYTDDYKEIVSNGLVNPKLVDAGYIFTEISDFHFYVPFKHLTNYCLNAVAFYNPHVSHLFSDFLHILNVLLCYFVILRLSKSYRIAFLTALFFAVAPVGSGAVNEIAARGHLFTAFFGFLSFLSYMMADSSGLKKNQDKHFIIFSVLVYFAGMFFWPTLIVLPLLMLVYEAVKDKHIPLKTLILKISPFAAAALIVLAVNLYVAHLTNPEDAEAVFDNGMIFSAKLFGWASVYKIPALLADYIIYCFVPPFFDIVMAPPLPQFSKAVFMYLGKICIAVLYVIMCVMIYRKDKKMLLAPAFFFVFLLPGIVLMYKTELISLRYMYLASTGIFLAFFAFLEYYIFPYLKGYKKWTASILIGFFFMFSAVNSYARKYNWESPLTVTNAMIANGGLAEVYGWFLKIRWFGDWEEKRRYLINAKIALEKNKEGYELQYALTNNNITGRITYITELLKNKQKN